MIAKTFLLGGLTAIIIAIMLLAIDVGNTTVAFGVFDGQLLVTAGKVVAPRAIPFGQMAPIDRVIISSVVPVKAKKVRQLVKQKLKLNPLFVTYKHINIKIALKNKNEVGVDRLVNAYAACKLYGSPIMVVDFGTATTFCAVSQGGVYQGGAISAGIGLTRQSLHEKTAKLPLIKIKATTQAIGKNTKEAMVAGIYLGYVGLVKELIARFKQKLGKVNVVATGGYAKLLSKGVKFDIIDEYLTLKGLQIIDEG